MVDTSLTAVGAVDAVAMSPCGSAEATLDALVWGKATVVTKKGNTCQATHHVVQMFLRVVATVAL